MTIPTNPFNIGVMKLEPSMLSRLPRIRTAETYDGLKGQFHPEGIYSTILFPEQGDERRDYIFGYIKLNTTIMHPYICHWLKKVKRLHESIWMGEAYAIFNPQTKEFEPSNIDEGQTGYAFFMKHLPELQFKRNTSAKRNAIIDNLEKYRDRYTMEYYLILPPGLRDLSVDEQGKTTEDEVNEHYRKMIRLSNSLEGAKHQGNEVDNIRMNIQLVGNIIFQYFKTMLSGKRGFLLSKWGSRNVHNGTRNVISSMDTSIDVLGSDRAYTVDSALVGLHQMLKACGPIIHYLVKQSPLYMAAFPQREEFAYLIDPVKMKRVPVKIEDYELDKWTTIEGIDKQIDKMGIPEIRSYPIMVQGHFLGLVYQDSEKYQLLDDIDELPAGWDKQYVHPITYSEFFYLIGKDEYYNKSAQITRYPVIGDRSTYVGRPYCKTTVIGLHLQEYQKGNPVHGSYALEYPDLKNPVWLNTVSPHSGRLSGLDGDFDGDMVSFNTLLTDDAIQELERKMKEKTFIIDAAGELKIDINTVTIRHAVNMFTKEALPTYHSLREGVKYAKANPNVKL